LSAIKTSAEVIQVVCNIGSYKPKTALVPAFILAFLAGAYIAFGGLLAIKVAGNIPVEYWGNLTRLAFAMVFPVGLLLVLLAGADLFTGNCMYLPAALKHKTATFGGLARSWSISYLGNFVGSILVVFFLGHLTGLLLDGSAEAGRPLADYAVKLANLKCGLSWDVSFFRGIGCNWLVCLAIYMSLAAGDGVSKAVLLWPPIAAFVAIGFEHSVANMTFIPMGILIGQSEIYQATAGAVPLTASWAGLVNNLVPVTLGNIVGGAVFVALFYYRANNLKPEGKPE